MAFTDPQSNLNHLTLREDVKVADIGAGSGAYSFALSRRVPNGTVYAVDIQKDLLSKLKSEAGRYGFHNIQILWADVERQNGTKLMNGFLDGAVVSNVLFQFDRPELAVKEVARIVHPRGRVLVVDWTDSFGGLGPAQSAVITASRATSLFSDAGFKKVEEFNAGDHHYGIVFEKI